MSDLPRDMEEEVLCRIPLTCLGLVRSTCKRWNMLSRCDHLFANKHLAHQAATEAKKKKDPLVVTMMNYRVELMRLNFSDEDEVVVLNPEAKLIGLDQIDVRDIFHCNGLLLCIPKEDHSRLLVWNPYWGRQPKWIENTHNHHLLDKHGLGLLDRYTYGLGYNNSSTSSYKILRFIDLPRHFVEFKIYDFNSDSWRILDLDKNWCINIGEHGLSLKGNTYWFAADAMINDAISFLVCFDFSTETFSPLLPLPFEAFPGDALSLSSSSSSVGGEYPQLVVLFQSEHTLEMEIWISNTIEQPNALSWNTKVFLSANIQQLIPHRWVFRRSVSFFIDQEKKIAVVFDKNARRGTSTHEIAYIFFGGGLDDDGSCSFKQQVVKQSAYPFCYSHACYYVPSLVQLS
ncbi:putative F-box protein [Raphanus sativus]|nr:putative F-box protein [Raphanus sativus]